MYLKTIIASILITLLVSVLTAQQDPFSGTFSGSGLTLTLDASGSGYSGSALFQGQTLPMQAQKLNQNTIRGTYTVDGMQFPFQAQVQGDAMTLAADGQIYQLLRQKTAGKQTTTSQSNSEKRTGRESGLAPGEAGDIYRGYKFKPPAGWTARKAEGGYLLVSETKKGFVLVVPHEAASLQELRQEARKGIVDENGTALHLEGEIKVYQTKGIAAQFKGTVERQPAKAYGIALMSPHGGGMTILAAIEEKSFSRETVQLAENVAANMKFFKPVELPVSEEWAQWLSGARLTYMWRYYSSGTSGSYVGGGETTVIDLCSKGYFTYSGKSDLAVDGGTGAGYNASGFTAGNNQGHGQWQVVMRGQQPVLVLKFYDGKIYEYNLKYEERKTYLNDKRFFRTYANDPVEEHRPECY